MPTKELKDAAVGVKARDVEDCVLHLVELGDLALEVLVDVLFETS